MEDSSTLRRTDTEELNTREDVETQALRLVLLGWSGSGKSSTGNSILGCCVFECRSDVDSEKSITVSCEKKSANVAGRQVCVVDTPDWFYSERPPEEVRRQLSLCERLSAPGPHAFLLCVSLQRENTLQLQALHVLEVVFGPEAVAKRTVVVFTHTPLLSEHLTLEQVLNAERPELKELVERCGGRRHVLALGEDEEKERRSVEELLEKVEEMVKECEEPFYTYPPLLKMEEEGGRGRRDKGEEEEEEEEEPVGGEEHGEIVRRTKTGEELEGKEEEEEEEEEEDKRVVSPPGPPPSFLRSVWDTVVSWLLWLPSLVRGSSVLGSVVGLFIGGIFGGFMGATVGSVATEVGRRKPQKTKTK